MLNTPINWEKSRKVYDWCLENNISTGSHMPIVSELTDNIILNEEIIGRYSHGDDIIIHKDALADAIKEG